jgi:Gpi18-like mannosyltransferase
VGVNNGLHNIYSIISHPIASPPTYPPIIPIMFTLLGIIYNFFYKSLFVGDAGFIFLLKILPIIFDFLSAYIIYKIVLVLTNNHKAKIAFILYLISPANIIISSLWGQVDSIVTFFMLLSVYFLMINKHLSSWLFLAISILSKQQAIIVVPLILVASIKKFGDKKTLKGIIVFLTIFILLFLPYIINGSFLNALSRIMETSRWIPALSANAFNFWWILFGTNSINIPDSKITFIISPLVLSLSVFFTLYYLIIKKMKNILSKKGVIFLALFIILFAFFMIPTQIHERYLFYCLPFLLIYSFLNKVFIKYYFILQVTFLLNILFISLPKMPNIITILIAVINAIVFIISLNQFKRINETE